MNNFFPTIFKVFRVVTLRVETKNGTRTGRSGFRRCRWDTAPAPTWGRGENFGSFLVRWNSMQSRSGRWLPTTVATNGYLLVSWKIPGITWPGMIDCRLLPNGFLGHKIVGSATNLGKAWRWFAPDGWITPALLIIVLDLREEKLWNVDPGLTWFALT